MILASRETGHDVIKLCNNPGPMGCFDRARALCCPKRRGSWSTCKRSETVGAETVLIDRVLCRRVGRKDMRLLLGGFPRREINFNSEAQHLC